MYVVVDGSYSPTYKEIVSCGVVIAKNTGFFIEKGFVNKHIQASSTLAEWFAMEKAIEEIYNFVSKEMNLPEVINIYTDYHDIVNLLIGYPTLDKVEQIPFKKKYYKEYVFEVMNKFKLLNDDFNGLEIKLNHFKPSKITSDLVVELHKKAHNTAKSYADEMYKNKVISNNRSDEVVINIRLEEVSVGKRQWVVYENGIPVMIGRLKEVVKRYQQERYDFNTLKNQNKLKCDNGTMNILKKYVPKLVV